MKNLDMANQIYSQMTREFKIARNLQHQNIVSYFYFVRSYCEKTKTYEMHNIIEKMEGNDMRDFI